ncbi:TetR/AcrR family transcriptional regulator [Sphingomonas sp. AP4-R1]|uniref:TetR/AcrR family transcriptional regulator n=1 Tax=Sphingomonas sp. AP4-R1 TaxID=2735134 RepID=UPI0014933A42|nr:TetR/AcrR family transcriptional regulator [Sphingomonas sp. AP4-R1]QJU58290.1 TetR/AcrR family transcriptional regulator [Sphingomonas sp. AP4-R1]
MTEADGRIKRYSPIEKRKIILTGAIKLFSEKGFQQTSVGELASHLGVTKPFIYSYFPNKTSLLENIYEILREIFFDAFDEVFSVSRTPDAQLYELIRRYAIVSLTHTEMAVIFSNEERSLSEYMQKRSRDDYDKFARIVAGILEDGARISAFDVDDPLISAQIVVGMVRWSHRWYSRTEMEPPEEMAARMARHALAAVTPRARQG